MKSVQKLTRSKVIKSECFSSDDDGFVLDAIQNTNIRSPSNRPVFSSRLAVKDMQIAGIRRGKDDSFIRDYGGSVYPFERVMTDLDTSSWADGQLPVSIDPLKLAVIFVQGNKNPMIRCVIKKVPLDGDRGSERFPGAVPK
jgi:hypothetical protein